MLHLPWYEGPVVARSPLVVNVHDLDTLEPHGGYSRRFRVYYNNLLRLYIRTARRIIVPSQASLSALQRRWPGRPYVHIPYGIDPVMFRAPGVGRAPEPTILYCGGYGERKRIPDLVEAFADVTRAIPAARLVLTGDPSPGIRRALQQLPRPEQIECVGVVPLARLVELYAEAWVVAYPSALEGFGFPVLEAFAAGTPIVAARGGSIPELAGDAAVLVSPGSAPELAEGLLRVLRDEKLAADLVGRGLRRVQAFTWQETAARTLETYADALA
jgi:glycosyltransferase involved in cell wall biosynthesis